MSTATTKLPPHLAGLKPQGLIPGEPIAQFEIGSARNFVYLVLDWKNLKAAIVDPQEDLSAPLAALSAHGFTLAAILLTHTHWDHIAGVPELARTRPEVPILLHPDDFHRLSAPVRESGKNRRLQDGERVLIGALELRALHTPGHSAGECCYLTETAPPYLLTGDTIFIRDCGRTDLESGSTAQMFESLNKIRALDPACVILPGHHYKPECASTLGRELAESPPFQCKSSQELEALP